MGHWKVVRSLRRRGANVHAPDKNHKTHFNEHQGRSRDLLCTVRSKLGPAWKMHRCSIVSRLVIDLRGAEYSQKLQM